MAIDTNCENCSAFDAHSIHLRTHVRLPEIQCRFPLAGRHAPVWPAGWQRERGKQRRLPHSLLRVPHGRGWGAPLDQTTLIRARSFRRQPCRFFVFRFNNIFFASFLVSFGCRRINIQLSQTIHRMSRCRCIDIYV